ncbi:MAG: pyridoxamine 5'-phosphate oxidase family protein [Candidatus Thorarchaeota archaeon]
MLVPKEFMDLVELPIYASLSTIMPKGYPQTTLVWFDYNDEIFRINTMKGFQKERNMRRNPKVSLLIYNIKNPNRFIEVRGEVSEMTEEGARDHLNLLSKKYTGKTNYFGDIIPKKYEKSEFPVLCKIKPKRIIIMPTLKEDEK